MNEFILPNVYTSPSTGDGYANPVDGSCRFLGMVVANQTGGTLYAQVHDGYATPSNGEVPKLSIKLTANAQQMVLLPSHLSIPLSSGLVICSSTTEKTLTVGAPTDLFITAFWV